MTPPISTGAGWLIFAAYGSAMLLLVRFATRPERDSEEHLVAGRRVGLFAGAFSIAVTWIWAPAVFICSEKSYEQGSAGLFWFTVPNVLCFFTFAPLALELRRRLPAGYSLPDFVWARWRDPKAHLAFLTVTLGYELGAIVINTLAGGLLMSSLTGIDVRVAIAALAGIALAYSVWRGLPASIVTDVVQMSMILFIAGILVPWAIVKGGGWQAVAGGFGGADGRATLFDPWIAYSFGIPATLGLISGPVADQMFYQRALAARRDRVVATFVVGGLLFGLVPIVLSAFGFLAANPAFAGRGLVTDPQLVSVSVVAELLPRWTLFGFALMALAALSSTLDSAYCAVGSLGSIDIWRRYVSPGCDDRTIVRVSRASMIAFTAVGTAIAMIPGIKLLWVFLVYGALASAALAPTLLLFYWKRMTPRGAFLAITLSFVSALPLSLWGNVTGNPHLVVVAAVASVVIGFLVGFTDGFLAGAPALPAAGELATIEAGEEGR